MKEKKTDLFDKWMKLAHDDYDMAVLASGHKKFLYAAFHLQQSMEKALKGVIILQGDEQPPYTHDLVRLYETIEGSSTDDRLIKFFSGLNPFYIQARYPSYREGVSSTLNQLSIDSYLKVAQEVMAWCERKKMP